MAKIETLDTDIRSSMKNSFPEPESRRGPQGMRRVAALRLRARSRKFFRLKDVRCQGFLDARIAHAKETRAIGRVCAHPRFENAHDLEHPQRVVSDPHFFR